jgi:hypothetical protein
MQEMTDVFEKLLIDYKELNKKLAEMEKGVRQLRKEVSLKRLEIWDTCPHTWVVSRTNFDDCCKRLCSHCGLWQDRSLYLVYH